MRKVREKMGLVNVWAMIPFVRTTEEGRGVIEGLVLDRVRIESPRELVGILEAAYDRNAPGQMERRQVLLDLDLTPLGPIAGRGHGVPSAPDAETGSPGRRLAHRGSRRPSSAR